jgi:hypothetical protein
MAKTQLSLNLCDELARAAAQFDGDCALGWFWFFQIAELTFQQTRIHEMSVPVPQLIGNEREVSAQVNELHVSIHM